MNWIIHDDTNVLNYIVDDSEPVFSPGSQLYSFEATPENIDQYRYLIGIDIYFPLPEN